MLLLVLAVVAPVLAVAALVPLRDDVENANLALALVVVVLLVAVVGGRVAGIVASLATAIAFDLFLTRPFNSLRITTSDDLQTTLLLGIIGLIAGELVERARRSAATAATTQATLDALYQHAELAAGTERPGRLIGLVADELTQLLDLRSCRYEPGPLRTPMPEFTHNGILVPGGVEPAARGLVALPVRAHGQVQGNLVMAFATPTVGASLTADQRYEAVALADQLGVGLLRFHDQPTW